MKYNAEMHRYTRYILMLLALCFQLSVLKAQELKEPLTVRVGLLAYEDVEAEIPYYRSLSEKLRKASSTALTIQYAFGNYSDLLHWIENDYIDLAVIGAGMHAALRSKVELGDKWRYVANEYHSFKDPGISCYSNSATVRDLKSLSVSLERKEIELVLVDPFSVSGTTLPLLALQKAEVKIDPAHSRFSYSHSNSIRLLKDQASKRFGCIWKSAAPASEKLTGLYEIRLSFPDLQTIPPSVVVSREASKGAKLVARLLTTIPGGEYRYDKDWKNALQLVQGWRSEMPAFVTQPSLKASLDDVVNSLIRDLHTTPDNMRLGLVLAGGGAKCSFQVGAVHAIEKRLAQARDQYAEPKLDISLVVGTSGGAINAIPTAMRLLTTDKSYQKVVEAWKDLDQREILRPSFWVRINLSVWLFALQSIFAVFVLGLFKSGWYKRPGLPIASALFFGIVQLALALVPEKPWEILGFNPSLHKFWLWLSFGIFGAAICHLTVAVIGVIGLRPRSVIFSRRSAFFLLLLISFALPAAQSWYMLLQKETLVEGSGIEQAIIRNFRSLIHTALEEEDTTSKEEGMLPNDQQMRALGEKVDTKQLIKRDLVLTTAPLSDPNHKLPAEYYWYYPTNPLNQPSYGSRGVSLKDRPQYLFDALMGSAAIYPVFPPRRINDFPQAGINVELVDGSFAHRSPLEAALHWGATHVILIEAATAEPVPRGSLLANVGAALSYLYDQAQLTDIRAHGQVKLFTLIPEPPHIGLLDFADNFIEMGIEKGYREAQGDFSEGVQGAGAFTQELGQPNFM